MNTLARHLRIPLALAIMATVPCAMAASHDAKPRFDATQKVFRLDAGKVTYAMGVNADGMRTSTGARGWKMPIRSWRCRRRSVRRSIRRGH